MRGLLPSTPSGSGWPCWVGVRVYVGTPFCVFWAGSLRVYVMGGLRCWPRPPSPTKYTFGSNSAESCSSGCTRPGQLCVGGFSVFFRGPYSGLPGTWHGRPPSWGWACCVAAGGYFRIVFFIDCLPILCIPARTAIACDRTVDRPVLSFIPNHHGPGVPVVGTTRLPIGCRYTKGFSSSPPR